MVSSSLTAKDMSFSSEDGKVENGHFPKAIRNVAKVIYSVLSVSLKKRQGLLFVLLWRKSLLTTSWPRLDTFSILSMIHAVRA